MPGMQFSVVLLWNNNNNEESRRADITHHTTSEIIETCLTTLKPMLFQE